MITRISKKTVNTAKSSQKIKKTTPIKKSVPKINNHQVAAIVRAIEAHMLSVDIRIKYSNWYCGISKYNNNTRLLQRKYKEDINGIYFYIWETDNKATANAIEKVMSEKGMLNAPHAGGAKEESKFVYVYKQKHSILDKIVLFIKSLSS